MIEEDTDLAFQITRQEVVLQQDPVLQGLVPAPFDIAQESMKDEKLPGGGIIRETKNVMARLSSPLLREIATRAPRSIIFWSLLRPG